MDLVLGGVLEASRSGLGTFFGRPRCAQDVPRWRQGGPRRRQDAPKTAKDGSKTPFIRVNMHPDGLNIPRWRDLQKILEKPRNLKGFWEA